MPLTPKTYGRSNPAALLAYQTAAQLRFALGRAGFEPDDDFPTLHGDITASDEPFVTLGRCSVEVIRRLVAILQTSAGAAGAVGTAELVGTADAATQGASDGLKRRAAPGVPELAHGAPEPTAAPASANDA
jgi:hypothetical protein